MDFFFFNPRYKKHLRDARTYELERHDIILCTCTQSSTPSLTKTVSARQILIDECAMATEPQALIPLVCNKPEKVSFLFIIIRMPMLFVNIVINVSLYLQSMLLSLYLRKILVKLHFKNTIYFNVVKCFIFLSLILLKLVIILFFIMCCKPGVLKA